MPKGRLHLFADECERWFDYIFFRCLMNGRRIVIYKVISPLPFAIQRGFLSFIHPTAVIERGEM